jgi:hypothetical protein
MGAEGASWVSVTLQRSQQADDVLSVFSNLEEIVVRRGKYGE